MHDALRRASLVRRFIGNAHGKFRRAEGSGRLDGDVVGVGGKGFDICSIAGEDGAAGFSEGHDDGVDG